MQRLTTLLTEKLNLVHPIVQGGLYQVGFAPLAAAVSNAGGLGIITALNMKSAEAFREEIIKCKGLTKKKFGVNLTLLPMLVPPDYEAYAKVVVEEGIEVVETAGHYKGLEPFIDLFKKHDITIMHKCTAIKHAKTAQRLGVDIISIDGFECAGHPGESDIGNWVLLAKAQEELDIPFIVSGGCATGSQLAAALSTGAIGMNMGTRFLATKEAPIHENVKQALVQASELDTTLVMRTMRNTERVYKNKAALEVLEIEKQHPGDFSKISHLIAGEEYRKVFQETGDIDRGVWSAGVVMGLIHDIPTCQELIDKIVADAIASIQKSHSMIVS